MGKGVKQDYSKANELYQKACDGDNVEACYSLANSYKQGIGIEQNISKAKELYKKSNKISCTKLDFI